MTKSPTFPNLSIFMAAIVYGGTHGVANAGPIIGLQIGQSDLSAFAVVTPRSEFLTTLKDNDNDISFAFDVGYQFNPYVSVVLSYIDFGEYKAEIGLSASQANPPPPATFELGFEGFAIAVQPTWPITDHISVFASLGYSNLEVNSKTTVFTSSNGGPQIFEVFKFSDKDDSALFGIGISTAITDDFTLKASGHEYEIEDEALRNFSLSLIYAF